jgi:hypothetical protein
MGTSRRGLAIVAVLLLSSAALAAEDSVTRFRLAGDASNVTACKTLDPALGRPHTVSVRNGDVEITSAGGIEGRMREIRPGVYGVVFELAGIRLDVVADLSTPRRALTVADRELGCKWQATPE